MEKGEIDFMLQKLVDFYFFFLFPKIDQSSSQENGSMVKIICM